MTVIVPITKATLVETSALELARQMREQAEQPVQIVRTKFQDTYWDHPVAFVHDCFRWQENEAPKDYQEEVLDELYEYKREAVRAGRGSGKTTIEAWAILWFALTRDGFDWKIVATASVGRQLSEVLWPEIHKWARRLRFDKILRPKFNDRTELLGQTLRLKTGAATSASVADPDAIEGSHADHLMYCFDEAKKIIDDVFDSAEGSLTGGNENGRESLALVISTPGEPTGRFYDIHRRRTGLEEWHVKHIPLDRVLAGGQVSKSQVDRRHRQWGPESALYKNQVLGEFASSATDGVIPLAWVEAAVDRWLTIADGYPDKRIPMPLAIDAFGVDVADGGANVSVIAPRSGNVIISLERYPSVGEMEVTGHLLQLLDRYGGKAVIDKPGVGAGVVGRMQEIQKERKANEQPANWEILAYNGAERTDVKDESQQLEFHNKRAATWWGMRDLLNPDHGHDIALPEDDQLIGDLTTPKYTVTSSGKILIQPKEQIRNELGRSPDDGDAVTMAFWDEVNVPAAYGSSDPGPKTKAGKADPRSAALSEGAGYNPFQRNRLW